jgi:hypothetical protein
MNDELLFEDSIDINKMFELHYSFLEILENDNICDLKLVLPEENDYGFIEYKRSFLSYENKLSKLKTQIYWRMSQGLRYNSQSSCYYLLGLENDGTIIKEISNLDFSKSIEILKKCIFESNIKFFSKKVFMKDKYFILIKFWKEEILKNKEIRIMLLGASDTFKTKLFIDIYNFKFNLTQNNKNKLFKSDIFDIHSTETEMQKTLTLHHQYINYESIDKEEFDIHIIDTPGNSIISNIRYLLSYNTDIIIHFNQKNNIYENILNKINKKYQNLVNITDTSYLQDFDIKKILNQCIEIYKKRIPFLNDIFDVVLVNENKLIQSHQNSIYNKYISFCYNLMDINIFDKISDINIRNIQYNYDFKSNILSKNSISIETDKPICKYIIGKTKILDKLNIDNINIYDSDNILTFHIIILNQIYIINSKSFPNRIIFDKIILISENYKNLPIFIVWQKNNQYFLKIIII